MFAYGIFSVSQQPKPESIAISNLTEGQGHSSPAWTNPHGPMKKVTRICTRCLVLHMSVAHDLSENTGLPRNSTFLGTHPHSNVEFNLGPDCKYLGAENYSGVCQQKSRLIQPHLNQIRTYAFLEASASWVKQAQSPWKTKQGLIKPDCLKRSYRPDYGRLRCEQPQDHQAMNTSAYKLHPRPKTQHPKLLNCKIIDLTSL